MMRILLFIHRYLAVAVGLLMALWCLSGFVMIYQPYPEFTAGERLAALAPLRLDGCCRTQFLPDDESSGGQLSHRNAERLAGAAPARRRPHRPASVAPRCAGCRARNCCTWRAAMPAVGTWRPPPRWLEEVRLDQWSIQTAGRNQPAHRIALDDAAGTELYINAKSGEIFQQTTRRERVLNWFGAIPHWLYPHRPAAQRPIVVAGGDLDFRRRYFPDADRPVRGDFQIAPVTERVQG